MLHGMSYGNLPLSYSPAQDSPGRFTLLTQSFRMLLLRPSMPYICSLPCCMAFCRSPAQLGRDSPGKTRVEHQFPQLASRVCRGGPGKIGKLVVLYVGSPAYTPAAHSMCARAARSIIRALLLGPWTTLCTRQARLVQSAHVMLAGTCRLEIEISILICYLSCSIALKGTGLAATPLHAPTHILSAQCLRAGLVRPKQGCDSS